MGLTNSPTYSYLGSWRVCTISFLCVCLRIDIEVLFRYFNFNECIKDRIIVEDTLAHKTIVL